MTSHRQAGDTNFALAVDGYIRLTLTSFLALPFEERIAWFDNDLRSDLECENIFAFRAGYCEWACGDWPARVSFGWAWIEQSPAIDRAIVHSSITSNVMLINSSGRDLGTRRTEALLEACLSFLDWRPAQISSSFEAARQPGEPAALLARRGN